MTHKVFDNFISKQDSDYILALMSSEPNPLSSDRFPWFFNKTIIDSDEEDHLDNYQFTHLFYNDNSFWSEFSFILQPLIEKINPKSLIRVKANLQPRVTNHVEGGYHRDLPFECKTAVYYVNSNDGYTLFKSGEKVESVQNRFVEFDSQTEHTSVKATDQKFRIVINFNYF